MEDKMGRKKEKSQEVRKSSNIKTKKNRNRSNAMTYTLIGFLVLVLLGGAYFYAGSNRVPKIDYDAIKDVSELRGWEMNPILSSQRFFGVASKAYKVAAEIPDVMDSLYCYCNCMLHSGHKSLKTCFTNNHGANCGICIDQALRAYELHKEGKDILTIRKMIDKEFA
jgi:hypothetical protein